MREWPDLIGAKVGMLTVIGQAPSNAKGQRRWICCCDCGAIAYKATDTLTNSDISMCRNCAAKNAITKARENLGFEGGTQIMKISRRKEASENFSGARGVYFERKTGRYRARLRFCGKLYNLGSYANLEAAIKARRRGEEEIYDKILEEYAKMESDSFPE